MIMQKMGHMAAYMRYGMYNMHFRCMLYLQNISGMLFLCEISDSKFRNILTFCPISLQSTKAWRFLL